MAKENKLDFNISSVASQEPIGDTRGWIRNLAMDEGMQDYMFWFRPKPVRQALTASYNKMTPIGMSHQYQTYSHTENVKFAFELFVNRLMLVKAGAVISSRAVRKAGEKGTTEGSLSDLKQYSQYIEDGRRFLEALMYPPVTPAGIIGNAPPACILVCQGL